MSRDGTLQAVFMPRNLARSDEPSKSSRKVRIYTLRARIPPHAVGLLVHVSNESVTRRLLVTGDMVGHKFSEFATTKPLYVASRLRWAKERVSDVLEAGVWIAQDLVPEYLERKKLAQSYRARTAGYHRLDASVDGFSDLQAPDAADRIDNVFAARGRVTIKPIAGSTF